MSDTHAHTANVQAEVQTGKPHIPPGHVEADRKIDRLDERQIQPMAPWLIGSVIVLVAVIAIYLLAT